MKHLLLLIVLTLTYSSLGRAACTFNSATASFPAEGISFDASVPSQPNSTTIQLFVDGALLTQGFSENVSIHTSAPAVGPGQHTWFALATCAGVGTAQTPTVTFTQNDAVVCMQSSGGCAITSGGVSCWGDNTYGELGNGNTTSSLIPVSVVGVSNARSITCGDNFSCVLLMSGAVQCWGRNNIGQLGDGTMTDRHAPVTVIASGISSISSGVYTTCVITTAGAPKCWGQNDEGQIGDGTTTNHLAVTPVSGLSSGVLRISTGGGGTCAVLSSGTLDCWGDNTNGQMGNNTTSHTPVLTPQAVPGFSGATDVSYGSGYVCAVAGGAADCWGSNAGGNLGDGTFVSHFVPVAAVSSNAQSVSAGRFFTTCAIVAGASKCWGVNVYGEVGNATSGNYITSPANVSGSGRGISVQAAAGSFTSCDFNAAHPYCWGWNDGGRVGDGTTTNRSSAVRVSGL